jgi:hypothetical protein
VIEAHFVVLAVSSFLDISYREYRQVTPRVYVALIRIPDLVQGVGNAGGLAGDHCVPYLFTLVITLF